MNNIQKRFLLFLGVCIPTRFFLTYLSYKLNKINKQYNIFLAIFILIIALGFIRIYFFGSESADAQLKWLGEEKVWWNHLRLIHGILYLISSILIFYKNKHAWIILFIDTCIGVLSFLDNFNSKNYFYNLI